jgi:tRNA threonylcarbamoyladenosine biosynthesis protein TsaE
MKLIINDLKDIKHIAKQFINEINEHKIIAFYGEMGAGKTTLIKAICNELGVTSNVTSPTFSIVNEYSTTNNKLIYHFDFYRLKTPEEALDFGVFEYFDSNNLCLIEWPEIIGNLIPENILNIKIEVVENGVRKISTIP